MGRSFAEFDKTVALVCASNQNRSVEAHALLLSKGFRKLRSFGTSHNCKLPGPSIDKPNIYPFGTPYKKIFEELKQQNPDLYKANGLLSMLDRNSRVKEAPERWQEEKGRFDIVITFEDRVFDIVNEDVANRDTGNCDVVHVFCINTKDNHEEAALGAQQALVLLQMLHENENWDDRLDTILDEFYKKTSKSILHNVLFY
mmetsp:Transcript_16865/g.23471  ORF Transcript_16865/g.23471 Transcript_16865/m.23471 type:complete len:200 (-) Transcript_16865:2615-3214(-)